jgi:septal ring factor EnvC (AmiA/AmiB activator)
VNPAELEVLAPLIGFVVCAFVVSIPVVAFSARYAAKPVVDALVRLREAQGKTAATEERLQLQERRMTLLENELQHIGTTLERLADAERFHAQLAAPRVPALTLVAAPDPDAPKPD